MRSFQIDLSIADQFGAARNARPRLRKVDEKFQPLRDRDRLNSSRSSRSVDPRNASACDRDSRNTLFTRASMNTFAQVTSGIATSEAWISSVDFTWPSRRFAMTAPSRETDKSTIERRPLKWCSAAFPSVREKMYLPYVCCITRYTILYAVTLLYVSLPIVLYISLCAIFYFVTITDKKKLQI